MGIAASTMTLYLPNVLGMQNGNFRSVPDTLTGSQKTAPIDTAKRTPLTLSKQQTSIFVNVLLLSAGSKIASFFGRP
jgi:hypothetical protein